MDESDIVLTAGKKFGVDEALVVYTSKIDVKESVLLKCKFGCMNYGKYWTCPPESGNINVTRDLLKEYTKAILVIGDGGKMELKKFKEAMLEIEKTLKLNNYAKAFAMTSGPCLWCEKCSLAGKKLCIYPEKKRPSLESMGIDLLSTLRKFKKNIDNDLREIEFPSFGLVLLD